MRRFNEKNLMKIFNEANSMKRTLDRMRWQKWLPWLITRCIYDIEEDY